MMKASVVSFLISLLLVAAVCSRGERVKDNVGNDLKTEQQYFIQPVKTASNKGGGLVPAPPKISSICPLGIVQALLPYQPGLPVNFSIPSSTMETTVDTQDFVTIEFQSKIWVCNEFSKFWEINESASAAEEPAILIGGTPPEPNAMFKIENAGEGAGANTYKFTTFTGSHVGTKPVGFFGAPQLVLTDDTANTLVVKFIKVDDATTATTSTPRVEKLGLRMFPFY